MAFVNLHVHTMYSILDAINKPEDIVKKVVRLKQTAVATTEHGNVHSAVKMFKTCKEHGIKMLYGVEAYICSDRREKNKDNKYFHLTLLAYNEQGRLNINKLVSISNLKENYYYKPRIDFELLEQYKDGLIVLSGCMASSIQRAIERGAIDEAEEIARKYHDAFGDNYYIEVQSHRDPQQLINNRTLVDIAKKYGIQWVVTADSHYTEPEDQELHSIFIQIGQNREAGETYNDTQIQSEEDARQLLSLCLESYEIDVAIANTSIIADKCNVHVPLSAPIIPHVHVPSEFKNEDEYLKKLCVDGWKRRGIGRLPDKQRKEYEERLYYEYDAICKMGFSGYYLLVQSYANSVKRRGIARGSGGGSLVAYLLNIVDIDPVKYGLYFERFIDTGSLYLLEQGVITPEELKIPDCD